MKALKAKTINLIPRMKDDPRRDALNRRRALLLTPVLVIVLIVLAVQVRYVWLQRGLDDELKGLEAYISASSTTAGLAEEQSLIKKLALCDGVLSFPQFNDAVRSNLINPANTQDVVVWDMSFDQARGLLTLNCDGPGAESAAKYVKELSANKA
ncbi:MAG: hypothetical protein FWE85_02460, partial [Clostridiales bacterium]|nr:hypothetical protein [Clostridiales bacterium]